MARLIDADALRNVILGDKKLYSINVNWAVNRILVHIDNAPTIEPTTVYEFKGCDNCELDRPKGKWIIHNDYNENCKYGCDQCGNLTNRNSSFCPDCGARMEGDV